MSNPYPPLFVSLTIFKLSTMTTYVKCVSGQNSNFVKNCHIQNCNHVQSTMLYRYRLHRDVDIVYIVYISYQHRSHRQHRLHCLYIMSTSFTSSTSRCCVDIVYNVSIPCQDHRHRGR